VKLPFLLPLNFYQVHGTMCCPNMLRDYENMTLTHHFFCYEAKAIYEANVLLIWGSLSLKLIELLTNVLDNMPYPRSVIHMSGCDLRINNSFALSSLKDILPINSIFPQCRLDTKDYRRIINEARQCLRA
jgi:NADH:ubiquinone oxidoreductase subunit B-like Fe-S oxidoreductase